LFFCPKGLGARLPSGINWPVAWRDGARGPRFSRLTAGITAPALGSAGVMDAITLLKDDHKTVESLFKQFEKAGDRAVKTKRQLVDQMIKELTTHAYIEETLFYPAARKAAPSTAAHVLESIEEHHVVVWMLSELAGMDPADERFTAKVTVLIENVRHHVKEEEKDWFPQVRKAMGSKALRQLGDELAAAKSSAPSDPLKNISATA
jgi:hemerythrin superfamily protein